MDKSLLHSLERLKSFKIRLPDVCLHPGRPVELEKWIKRPYPAPAAGQPWIR